MACASEREVGRRVKERVAVGGGPLAYSTACRSLYHAYCDEWTLEIPPLDGPCLTVVRMDHWRTLISMAYC